MILPESFDHPLAKVTSNYFQGASKTSLERQQILAILLGGLRQGWRRILVQGENHRHSAASGSHWKALFDHAKSLRASDPASQKKSWTFPLGKLCTSGLTMQALQTSNASIRLLHFFLCSFYDIGWPESVNQMNSDQVEEAASRILPEMATCEVTGLRPLTSARQSRLNSFNHVLVVATCTVFSSCLSVLPLVLWSKSGT